MNENKDLTEFNEMKEFELEFCIASIMLLNKGMSYEEAREVALNDWMEEN